MAGEKISVKPGERLSLKHHHRAEHWIVVKGTAMVERDGASQLLVKTKAHIFPWGANIAFRTREE